MPERQLEYEFRLVNRESGEELSANVKVVIIVGKGVSSIRSSRPPTPEEQETILLAIERAVSLDLGADVERGGVERCVDTATAQISVRRILGGGQG